MAKLGPLECWVDLDAGFVRYGCGWNAPITHMIDLDGDQTLDPNEAVVVVAKVPESYVVVQLYDTDEEEHLDS